MAKKKRFDSWWFFIPPVIILILIGVFMFFPVSSLSDPILGAAGESVLKEDLDNATNEKVFSLGSIFFVIVLASVIIFMIKRRQAKNREPFFDVNDPWQLKVIFWYLIIAGIILIFMGFSSAISWLFFWPVGFFYWWLAIKLKAKKRYAYWIIAVFNLLLLGWGLYDIIKGEYLNIIGAIIYILIAILLFMPRMQAIFLAKQQPVGQIPPIKPPLNK